MSKTRSRVLQWEPRGKADAQKEQRGGQAGLVILQLCAALLTGETLGIKATKIILSRDFYFHLLRVVSRLRQTFNFNL